ncbi:hypothetical protein ABT369_33020 [Dactylosporangium sp. NPDC000244]|uniref:hypothetical protein n=1 Tax=Dactylosporangium sp. NPDC000244 TaxID=3154365 RepID=UPI00333083FA
MVTRRLAALLLAIAALRWPDELRAEMLAEWSAEVHALAAAGRRGRALTFAASLAASRPRVRAFSVVPAARGVWSCVRLLVVLPALAVTGGYLAYCLMVGFMPLAIAVAVAMAVLGGTYVPRRVPVVLLIPAVTLPGGALFALVAPLIDTRFAADRHTIEVAVFCWLLMAALAVAALLVRGARQRAGWIAGILGAFVATAAAIMVRY